MISLELKNLSVSFGPNRILTDLDAVIPGGAITSVIGQNGGGKTTLANLICRFFDPHGLRNGAFGTRERPLLARHARAF